MAAHRRSTRQWLTGITLAASLLVSTLPPAFSAPVNSVNDGKDIVPGEYENTAGNSTRFINSAGTGLHLHAGDVVVGREVDATGSRTGNGGSLHFDAPGQVVRLDGNIDVRGMDAAGAIVGKGGNVRVDAGFLYQTGQIWANGTDGGIVTFNVGSLVMGPNSRVDASGLTGNGGVVDIKSPGAVDIKAGAIIDTSGQANKVVGTYNTNVIRIEGGLVNLEGILKADGKLPGQDGGLIDVKATGNTKPLDGNALDKATTAGIFTTAERDALIARDALLRNGDAANGIAGLDGSIQIASTSIISANGANGANQDPGCGCAGAGTDPTPGGNGGEIRLDACKDIYNNGVIQVNGGHAGQFVADAKGSAQDMHGADGLNGGDAGKVAFYYRGKMTAGAASSIQAKGGNGANGQNAKTDSVHTAYGGKGGDGGNGGNVEFYGPDVTDAVKNTVDVKGGDAGKGGNQPSGCGGCDAKNVPGNDGAPGNDGQIIKKPAPAPCPTCDEPPPPCIGGDCNPPEEPPEEPPNNPPNTPPRDNPPDGRTLYPKEYPRLGETLPGRVGPLLNYNRSVFLARAPLPIVKKRPAKLFPARVVPPPPAMKKPKPPQKKAPVRGYW